MVTETMNVGPLMAGRPQADGLPRRSGQVSMLQTMGGRTRRAWIVLSLYNSSFDTYAVVSTNRAMCKDCGYISLRNCSVQPLPDPSGGKDNIFQIAPQDCDGNVLTFSVASQRELSDWVDTISSLTSQEAAVTAGGPWRRPQSPRTGSPAGMKVPRLASLEEEDSEE